jgi:hypothetical protein
MKLIILLFLIGCSDKRKIESLADKFCKCHDGVAIVQHYEPDSYVMCNDGFRAYISDDSYVGECK